MNVSDLDLFRKSKIIEIAPVEIFLQVHKEHSKMEKYMVWRRIWSQTILNLSKFYKSTIFWAQLILKNDEELAKNIPG